MSLLALRRLRRAPPSALVGLGIILAYALAALLAPALAPYGEREIVGAQFESWSAAHPLGTDSVGRDMLSRLIFGARNTVSLAVVTTLVAFAVGAFAGIFAALKGRWTDQILARAVDSIMAIPSLILKLLLLTVFGTSILNLVLIIAFVDSTRVFRLSRALTLSIVVMDYIEAARLRGDGAIRIILREILPNAAAPLMAEFGLRFCFVFLAISALSFLGLGIQPPLADWGSMVRENASLIAFGDITPLLPAFAIAILTVGMNLVVDWMLQLTSGLKD